MNLRLFQPTDAEALADVYRDSVRTIGSQVYSQKQIDAWVRSPEDIKEFRARLSVGVTVLAEEKGEVIAFGQFSPPDHLSLLYCSGRWSRRGVGSLVYDELERHAITMGAVEIKLEASRISRPFFEKKGYHVVEAETSVFLGVEFERFRMKKRANQSPQPTLRTVTPRATESKSESPR